MLLKYPRQQLTDLEAIKHIMNEKPVKEAKKAMVKSTAALANTNSIPKKWASTGSNEWVSKKAHTAKSCQHCKTNDRPYTFHNTNKCCKYDKDGKAVVAFQEKAPQEALGWGWQTVAYLLDAIESLAKKGLQKAGKKKCKKRTHDSSSSNSNSE